MISNFDNNQLHKIKIFELIYMPIVQRQVILVSNPNRRFGKKQGLALTFIFI